MKRARREQSGIKERNNLNFKQVLKENLLFIGPILLFVGLLILFAYNLASLALWLTPVLGPVWSLIVVILVTAFLIALGNTFYVCYLRKRLLK
jgi:sterol desaturase/sphingolipid hydroxylase (fatty acid hydroxylase superfamily)